MTLHLVVLAAVALFCVIAEALSRKLASLDWSDQ